MTNIEATELSATAMDLLPAIELVSAAPEPQAGKCKPDLPCVPEVLLPGPCNPNCGPCRPECTPPCGP